MRDLLVIGGGINGAGIARDAAGRGLSVTLCERDDFAQHTSSASTKLIHGGLRYLEQYDFALVRKALIEREILLRAAPHIIWPMRFVLPHRQDLRPAWLIRLGLFLYDHLGGRKILPPTTMLRRGDDDRLGVLHDHYRLAFEYSDCWVEDARLVVLNVMDAEALGAEIRARTTCTALRVKDGAWTATFEGPQGASTGRFKTVINAAGGWVDDVLGQARPGPNAAHLRLVKGSHIVVPRWHEGDHAFFFQNGDGRIMFAIPYEQGKFTLIGTTDIAYDGPRGAVQITAEEIQYLCDGASEYYARAITPGDVVWTYSGVRPLYDDHAENASKVTRDYVLRREVIDGAPLLSVFGGKITTYRELAQHALQEMRVDFPALKPNWTKTAALPGGDMPDADFEGLVGKLGARFRWLAPDLLRRLTRAYGTRVPDVIGAARSIGELGRDFGAGLTEAEVHYLVSAEYARTADDILWRRSKLGLHMTQMERTGFAAWFAGSGLGGA
jgi:glycerol-3-phosphate dehydrogenase